MIETIYNSENQEEENIKLPKNIHQIGSGETKYHIYIESKVTEFLKLLRHFCRYYEFLLQVSSLEDTELQKKYNYISYLLKYINISNPGDGYDLTGKLKADNFIQEQSGNHEKNCNGGAGRRGAGAAGGGKAGRGLQKTGGRVPGPDPHRPHPPPGRHAAALRPGGLRLAGGHRGPLSDAPRGPAGA